MVMGSKLYVTGALKIKTLSAGVSSIPANPMLVTKFNVSPILTMGGGNNFK